MQQRDKSMYHCSFLHASKSGIEAQLRARLLCGHRALRKVFLLLQPRKTTPFYKTQTQIHSRNAANLLPLGSLQSRQR